MQHTFCFVWNGGMIPLRYLTFLWKYNSCCEFGVFYWEMWRTWQFKFWKTVFYHHRMDCALRAVHIFKLLQLLTLHSCLCNKIIFISPLTFVCSSIFGSSAVCCGYTPLPSPFEMYQCPCRPISEINVDYKQSLNISDISVEQWLWLLVTDCQSCKCFLVDGPCSLVIVCWHFSWQAPLICQ